MVKFIDSWSGHTLKVTISMRYSSQGAQKCKSTLLGVAFTKNWEWLRYTSSNWEINILILVMFASADQFFEYFLDIWFLLRVLTRYVPYVHKRFGNSFFKTLSLLRSVLNRFCETLLVKTQVSTLCNGPRVSLACTFVYPPLSTRSPNLCNCLLREEPGQDGQTAPSGIW